MFRIITLDGKLVGVTETVRYIKIHPHNGCFVEATKNEAVGIAYRSNPYNLIGHDEIKDRPTVFVKEFDGAEEIDHLSKENEVLTTQLAETDEAAIELYETSITQELHNAEQDEAIIEIYEMIGDINNG